MYVRHALAIAAACIPLAGCAGGMLGGSENYETGASLDVALVTRNGQPAGAARIVETGAGVLVRLTLSGLTPGVHAVHFHENAVCEPPFESAGDHFNPDSREHGFLNPGGTHAGDLPNITVDQNGTARVDVPAPLVTLDSGRESLTGEGGTSLVIHSGADDYRTNPAGDSGARVACGVVRWGQ